MNYLERKDNMSDYYVIEASKNVEEYVSVIDSTASFVKPCQMSEFQFFDTKPISLEVDADSGKVFQDFMYDKGVPIISDRLKECFEDLGVDYLFYKKILLTKQNLGVEEIYWLAIPPRINCLNREESDIDEVLNVADEIVINEDKVGRYEVFKLSGVGNLEIIVSSKIADVLKSKKYIGLHIYKID